MIRQFQVQVVTMNFGAIREIGQKMRVKGYDCKTEKMMPNVYRLAIMFRDDQHSDCEDAAKAFEELLVLVAEAKPQLQEEDIGRDGSVLRDNRKADNYADVGTPPDLREGVSM